MFAGSRVFCEQVKSINRYLCILKFLRFSDVDYVVQSKNSPKTHIEQFLQLLCERCQAHCQPGLHMAIDESLMLWKGRLGFKQFIRTKRSQFGIKIFVLFPSSADFSGYSWNLEIYYGKDSNYRIVLGDPASDNPEDVRAVEEDSQI